MIMSDYAYLQQGNHHNRTYIENNSMVPGLIEASNTPRNVLAAAISAKLLALAWHINKMPQMTT